MDYISVCSGIEAATVAWSGLGWKAKAFSEIEKFPSAVLSHHYPSVPNVGDFTKIEGNEYGKIDLLVGGTPCQDFSVAGPREGLDGHRGQLTIEFARLAERLRSRWILWENVPGVLSADGGRAFGTFLKALGDIGYGFAYRILDAQYFGVPQRRRRVFLVGYLGDWRSAAAVLFERESLLRNPPPSREERKETTTSFASSSHGGYQEEVGTIRASGGDLGGEARPSSGGFPSGPAEVSPTLDTHFGDKQGLEDQHINGGGGSLCASLLTTRKREIRQRTTTLSLGVPLTRLWLSKIPK